MTARALQTLVEDEMEDSLEPTIADFLPKAENAFTKLHTDCNNMRVSTQYLCFPNQTYSTLSFSLLAKHTVVLHSLVTSHTRVCYSD